MSMCQWQSLVVAYFFCGRYTVGFSCLAFFLVFCSFQKIDFTLKLFYVFVQLSFNANSQSFETSLCCVPLGIWDAILVIYLPLYCRVDNRKKNLLVATTNQPPHYKRKSITRRCGCRGRQQQQKQKTSTKSAFKCNWMYTNVLFSLNDTWYQKGWVL